VKLSKYDFYQKEVEYLRFIVRADSMKMDPIWVKAIAKWLAPKSFRDI